MMELCLQVKKKLNFFKKMTIPMNNYRNSNYINNRKNKIK